MARNFLGKNFVVRGYDKRPEMGQLLASLGGIAASSANDAATGANAVFLMVMTAGQIADIVAGGLLDAMAPGSTLIITATVGAECLEQLAQKMQGRDIRLIDAPVSGGKGGAEGGTLSFMAAAPKQVLADNQDVLLAIGSTVIPVGELPGQGQVIKACLQALIGVSFEGLFEAMVLGAQAGVDLNVLSEVINNSYVGSRMTAAVTDHIVARRFRDTGSHISTMHKDIGISMELANKLEVPMPATEVAMRMFSEAFAAIPDGDNWCIVEYLERMVQEQKKRHRK
jgi:3-hydroxyisobutyrate dehydrogenase-like beta-hydroxyacid dehydrogenase